MTDRQTELRFIGADHYPAFVRAAGRAFGWRVTGDAMDAFVRPMRHGRALAAFDGAEVVGTFMAYSLRMNIPDGRTAPVAVVSDVSALPTHRRRGLLTRMMERQLRAAYDNGDLMAILGASESVIYGRFGYGIATHNERWSIDRRHTALEHAPPSPGRVRFVEKDEAMRVFPDVAARACAYRPGFVPLLPEHWEQWRVVSDLEQFREGWGEYNYAVYEENGRIDGYVAYRIRDRTVGVVDLMAASKAAHAALWAFCFGIDLRTTIESNNRPVDDALPWMLADPRQLNRSRVDSMWLRILDARKALEARAYAREGRIVFELRDAFCAWNAGRYELEGGPDGARCKLTAAAPDITLSAAELGAAYLGGVSFSVLAGASRVDAASPEALRLADGMFGAGRMPWWPHEL